jgi:hypothetical protein
MDTLMSYVEMLGQILLAKAGPEKREVVLVFRDPNWFLSHILGQLLDAKIFNSTVPMLQSRSAFCKQLSVLEGLSHVYSTVLEHIPLLLEDMHLLYPFDSDFVLLAFLELSCDMLGHDDAFWTKVESMMREHISSYQCCGRLISLKSRGQHVENFMAGTFSRFQIGVATALLSQEHNIASFMPVPDCRCHFSPYVLEIEICDDDGGRAILFAQMVHDTVQIWTIATDCDAIKALCRSPHIPPHERTHAVLTKCLDWFYEVSDVRRQGATIYCIDPVMRKSLLHVGADMFDFLQDLTETEQSYLADPNNVETRQFLLGPNNIVVEKIDDSSTVTNTMVLTAADTHPPISDIEHISRRMCVPPHDGILVQGHFATSFLFFFICPVKHKVCCTNNGEGYDLNFDDAEWPKTYGADVVRGLRECQLLVEEKVDIDTSEVVDEKEAKVVKSLSKKAITVFIRAIKSRGDLVEFDNDDDDSAEIRLLHVRLQQIDVNYAKSGLTLYEAPSGKMEWVSHDGKLKRIREKLKDLMHIMSMLMDQLLRERGCSDNMKPYQQMLYSLSQTSEDGPKLMYLQSAEKVDGYFTKSSNDGDEAKWKQIMAQIMANMSKFEEVLRQLVTQCEANTKSLQKIHNHHEAEVSGVLEIPLLFVVNPNKSTDIKDRMRRQVSDMWEINFLCSVCGNQGETYSLNITKEYVQTALVVVEKTLCALQIAAMLIGLPLPLNMRRWTESAQSMLPAVAEKVKAVHTQLTTFVTAQERNGDRLNIPSIAQKKQMWEQVHRPTITHEDVKITKNLLAELKDPEARKTGLRRVISDDGSATWVCRDTACECYMKFKQGGKSVLLINHVNE